MKTIVASLCCAAASAAAAPNYDGVFTASGIQCGAADHAVLELRSEPAPRGLRLEGRLTLHVGAPKPGNEVVEVVVRGFRYPHLGPWGLQVGRVLKPKRLPMLGLRAQGEPPADGLLFEGVGHCSGPMMFRRDARQQAQAVQRSESAEAALQAAPLALADAGNDEQRCLTVMRWSRRWLEEYPDRKQRASAGAAVAEQLANLFADGSFIPVFGKAYDQMSAEERQPAMLLMRRCRNDQASTEHLDTQRVWLQRAFSTGQGSLGPADIGPRVQRRRVADAAVAALTREFETAQPSADGPRRIDAALQRAQDELALLWPSEAQAVRALGLQAKRRIGADSLAARVELLLQAPRDLAGALDLHQAPVAWRDMFELVPAQLAQSQRQRLAADLALRLEELLAAERRQMEGWPTGMEGLAQSLAWYRSFAARYAAFGPEVLQATLAAFRQQREAIAANAEREWTAAVAAATSPAALTPLEASRLDVLADHGLEAPARLRAVVQRRRAALDVQRERAKWSEGELLLMSSPGLLRVPARYEAPTDTEVGLAFLRAFANMGGQLLGPTSVRYGMPPLQLAAMRIELKSAQKVACKPAPVGHECQFRVAIEVGPDGSMQALLGGSIQGRFMQWMFDTINRAEPRLLSETFVLTPSGWRAPGIEKALAENAAAYWEGIADTLRTNHQARCDAARMSGRLPAGCS